MSPLDSKGEFSPNQGPINLKMYRLNRANCNDVMSMKKSINEGKITIEFNGKIVKDNNQIDFVLANYFDELLKADTRVIGVEMQSIIGACTS